MSNVLWCVIWMVCGAVWAQPVASVVPDAGPLNVQGQDLRTVAEASNWEATSTSAQVIELMDRLARLSPRAVRLSMGTTHEGREMPVLVVSEPIVRTADEARELAEREGRVIVLLFGNIHAGEVDAKEAYLMLARELALAPEGSDLRALLSTLIICIAPNYNADGNDKFGPIDVVRPGQVGPVLGAGTRHNAMDRDLNRDWGKLETPEARNLVRFIDAWQPHVVVDGHTTNGSWHRYLMTYAGPKVPAGDAELIRWTRDDFFPALDLAMRDRHGIDTFLYGDFEGVYDAADDGLAQGSRREHSKWTTFPALARYSTGYLGLRGHIGILSESYAYSSYRDRIIGSRALGLEVLALVARERTAVRELVAHALLDGAGKGAQGAREIVIRSAAASAPGTTRVKGYVEELRNGRWTSTGEERDYEVTVWDRSEPTLRVTRPDAYVFLEDAPAVIATLRAHGIRAEQAERELVLDGEIYRIDHISAASRLWQGHLLVTVDVTPEKQAVRVAKGSFIVRTDQPLGTLAAYLLEPACEDGLTTWNFFDAWLGIGERFPVARVWMPNAPQPAAP